MEFYRALLFRFVYCFLPVLCNNKSGPFVGGTFPMGGTSSNKTTWPAAGQPQSIRRAYDLTDSMKLSGTPPAVPSAVSVIKHKIYPGEEK